MNKLTFIQKRERRTKGQTLKGLSLSALSLFIFLFLISFTSAETMGYGKEITYPITGANYTINVNNSDYLQGYTPITLKNWIQGLFDSIFLLKTEWNATNTSYVPYTGANQNVNLGNNNLTVNGTALFVNTNNSRVGIGTTGPVALLHLNNGVGALANGIAFGDGDTGFYESADDILKYWVGGNNRWIFASGYFSSAATNGAYLKQAASSATIPSFAFVGDEDTGMGRATTNELSLITGASEAIRIDSTGNVGIGTGNPFTTLHVNGSILANGTINSTSGFGVNGKSGITGNYTILKDADLIALTKTYCFFNITGGLITGTNC